MNRSPAEKTRARVLDLLRRKVHTVEELALELGLTDNAVRVHLASLEKEGIVRQAGVRRSGTAGKPAVLYHVDPASEAAFSRVYAPVLATLAETLGERLSSAELEEVFREVGRRIAAMQPAPVGNLQKRVRALSVALNQMGALTTVEVQETTAVLRGASCPLGVAVSRRPEVCKAVEELLAVLGGARVEQLCQHGDRPACCFQLSEAS
ncbi:MAG: helix-turn-helix transcriptional regulator [Longimicrobiales bacterium]